MKSLPTLAAIFCVSMLLAPAHGQAERRVRISGDARFRLESDFDSVRGDGNPQDDRTRGRVRLRLAGHFQALSWLRVGGRLRAGSTASQQSPHITIFDLNGNPLGDYHVVPDQYYLQVSQGDSQLWLGRSRFPFWRQDEILWDDDVTPTGLSGVYTIPGTDSRLRLLSGLFLLPDGAMKVHGNMKAAQLLWNSNSQGKSAFATRLGSGLYWIDGKPGARHLRSEFAEKDYSLVQVTGEVRFPVGHWPLRLGGEWLHNSSENVQALPGQDHGYLGSVTLGQTEGPRTWSLTYVYARIGLWSVHPSYGQDDWFRWGTATQTDSSDFKGHQWHLNYRVTRAVSLSTRFFTVASLSDKKESRRLRFDVNYQF